MFSAQGAQYGISIGKQSFPNSPGGGGILPEYGLYRYVQSWRVWFSSSLLWDRVYKSESLGLE